jgi:hypothetical protein
MQDRSQALRKVAGITTVRGPLPEPFDSAQGPDRAAAPLRRLLKTVVSQTSATVSRGAIRRDSVEKFTAFSAPVPERLH